jgi:uncharacterized membrane protein
VHEGIVQCEDHVITTIVPILALTSALLSAVATIFVRQGLRRTDPYTGVWISVLVGTAGLWLCVLVTGGAGPISTRSVLLFVSAGLIGTVGGRMTRFLGIEKVGAGVASAVGNLTPLIASILAVAVLGERVTLPLVVGTVIIVAGTALLSASGRGLGFRPWMIVLPLASATCFGIVQVIRKLALNEMGPLIGATINLTTALVAFSAFMIATRHGGIFSCRGWTLAYLVAAGVTENASVLLLLVALSFGAVSVVTPLTAASPLFVLLLTPFFLKGVEVLTARVVTGAVLIVIGLYLVTALAGR